MKKLIISLFFIFSGLFADNHDVHCEGFMTESDCSVHVECEWHTNEMACEDAVGHNDHADDDHADDDHADDDHADDDHADDDHSDDHS